MTVANCCRCLPAPIQSKHRKASNLLITVFFSLTATQRWAIFCHLKESYWSYLNTIPGLHLRCDSLLSKKLWDLSPTSILQYRWAQLSLQCCTGRQPCREKSWRTQSWTSALHKEGLTQYLIHNIFPDSTSSSILHFELYMQSTLNKIRCYWECHSEIRSVSHSISFSKCTKHTGLTGEFMYKSRLIQKSCKHPTPDTENPSVSQAAKLNAKNAIYVMHSFLF